MNFFTKPITYKEFMPMTCGSWTPGTFNRLGFKTTILDILKLKFQLNIHIPPHSILETMYLFDGWDDGWILISNQIEEFINSSGPTKGMNLKLNTLDQRKHAHKILIKDTDFFGKDLRLKTIELIEKLP